MALVLAEFFFDSRRNILSTSYHFDLKFYDYYPMFEELRNGIKFPTEEEAKAYAQKFYDRFVVEIEARQKEGAGR